MRGSRERGGVLTVTGQVRVSGFVAANTYGLANGWSGGQPVRRRPTRTGRGGSGSGQLARRLPVRPASGSGGYMVNRPLWGLRMICQPLWWMLKWHDQHVRQRLSSSVGPRSRIHQRTWWIWQRAAGAPHPTHTLSLAMTATRCRRVGSRRVRPASSTAPLRVMTTLVVSASQQIICAVAELTGPTPSNRA
jgi:hypothetical protein